MNFNQWQGHLRKGNIAKVTYCCGDETILSFQLLQQLKDALRVPATDYIEASPYDNFWQLASMYPLDPEASRLIVVKDAEKIIDWSPLSEWLSLSREVPKNYLIFLSEASDAPSIFAKGKRISYAEYIEIIRAKGHFVRCSSPKDEDLVSLSRSYGLTQTAAECLVERTSGDIESILQVLKKVHIWNGSPNAKVITLLCQELALDPISDYLMIKDKVNARLALATLSEDEKLSIIPKLEWQLDAISQISKYVRKRMFAGDISATTGIKVYTVKRLMPLVKDYDMKRIKYCRQLLTLVDSAVRSGATTGPWEVLISLW